MRDQLIEKALREAEKLTEQAAEGCVPRAERRRGEAVLRQKGDTPHGLGRRPRRNARLVRKAARRAAKLQRRKNR